MVQQTHIQVFANPTTHYDVRQWIESARAEVLEQHATWVVVWCDLRVLDIVLSIDATSSA